MSKAKMKDVEFLQDHGTREKGDIVSYHETTAEALQTHKIIKILGDTKTKEVVVDKLKQKVHDVKK